MSFEKGLINPLHTDDSRLVELGQPLVGEKATEEEREGLIQELDANGNPIKLANNTPSLTIFLLVNTMIGSGILNQPYVFKASGLVGGFIGFIIATYCTWLSLLIISDAGITNKVLEYSGLAKLAFAKTGLRINDISIVIGAFGALLGYVLVIGSTMSDLLSGWGCHSDICGIYGTTLTFITLFVLPLCLMRQFGHLAYVSIFSIFTIVLVLGLVMIGGPIRTKGIVYSEPLTVFSFKGMLTSIGSIIFALSCTAANFQAYVAADKPSRNMTSWSRITGIAVLIGATMCAVMGLCGYLSFQSTTQQNILSNFTAHGFDFFKMMVVCHICAYIPVNFVIMRYSIVKLALDKKAEALSQRLHVAITVILLYFTVAFALGMIKAGLAAGDAYGLTLDITGGVGGSITGFIMPSAIYLKVMPEDAKYRTHSKVLFCAGWLFMVLVIVGIVLSRQV